MGVSLYTSRVVLNTLGIEDFGIYSVVVGVISLLGFFNSAMLSASQRFLAIDIGKEDWRNLHKTFNSALIIHVAIAVLVLLIAETVGFWFLNHKLNLPGSRMGVANFVYQFSIFTAMAKILQVPFTALIVVRERMGVFALISIIEAILNLLVVYLLCLFPYDKLTTYAILLFIPSLFIVMVYKVYCLQNFKETTFSLYKDTSLYKTLISYSGWSLFGNVAAVAKGQGINILLNLFFGTIVNAAYGIMMQVQNAVNSFVLNFQMAVNPQIFKNYAQGSTLQMQKLMFQSSKFSYFLMFVLICPVIFNINFILTWWLKNPPPYTGVFVNLTLINLLIECISGPLITGSLATGKIKWYQIVVGTTLFLNLPVSYWVFRASNEPSFFLYVAIVFSLITLVLRLAFLKKMLDLDIVLFLKSVIFPTQLATITSVCILYVLNSVIEKPNNFLNCMEVCICITIMNIMTVFILGFDKTERSWGYNLISNKLGRKKFF